MADIAQMSQKSFQKLMDTPAFADASYEAHVPSGVRVFGGCQIVENEAVPEGKVVLISKRFWEEWFHEGCKGNPPMQVLSLQDESA